MHRQNMNRIKNFKKIYDSYVFQTQKLYKAYFLFIFIIVVTGFGINIQKNTSVAVNSWDVDVTFGGSILPTFWLQFWAKLYTFYVGRLQMLINVISDEW